MVEFALSDSATPGTSRGCPESGGYVARGDRDDTTVSIAVEGAKDAAREAKGASKAVAKTYHTLKDMISGRFRSGGASGEPKVDETAGLNNVSEEARKSTRERAERDADDAATRRREVVNAASLQPPAVTARAQFPPQYFRPPSQGGDRIASPLHHQQQQQAPPLPQFTQRQMPITMNRQQMMDQAQCRGPPVPVAVSTPQHGHAQALYEAAYNTPSRTPIQQPNDAIYYRPQYGAAGNMPTGVPTDFRADMLHHTSGFLNPQQPSMSLAERIDNDRSVDVRSPQQLEREILRQRGLADSRRTASQPQLPQEQEQNQSRLDQIGSSTPANKMNGTPMRRGSHGNLIETLSRTQISSPIGDHEKDSDDGGFRSRLMAQGRSFDNKDRVHGNSGMLGQHSDRNFENVMKLNKCDINDDKSDPIYGGMTSRPVFNSIPQAALRQTDLNDDGGNTSNMISKKINPGSAASSDYDKNGGPSSNVDSGRGSAAYSSGRHIGHDTSTESDPLPNRTITAAADHPGSSSKMYHEKNGNGGDSEWVDIVESELRQILDPKMQNGNPSTQLGGLAGSETASSVTPPLPPLSPPASTPDATPRNSARFKHQSLPYGSKPEYTDGRVVLPNQRAGWQHTPKHRSNTSKKQEQYVQYKKQMFGLDTTDITSTTTRSLDLSSMLDGQSDSDVSTQDARAIRRQLQGLEKMYCEVLKLLGVRKPTNHSLGKYQPTDPRMAKRRYGSVSSLPSSSVSSRPVRDKRRNATDQRKKVNDMQGINKRFQRLESHVVTLARSVAHLSSEMRTQHLMIQEMENIRGEITALRNQQRSQSMPRMDNSFCAANNTYGGMDASSLANPTRVKKLTKFFGDEPPLLRMFLKKLGYEKYAPLLENERVGAAELPFLGEERLRALGVPLGPRLRILHEARLALPPANSSHTTLCIV